MTSQGSYQALCVLAGSVAFYNILLCTSLWLLYVRSI